MHKALVFLLSTLTRLGGFSSTIFLSDSNDLLVFFFSFPIELGGFSLINLSGFSSQFSYWVRSFFYQDRITMFFIDNLFIDNFSIYDSNDFSVFFLSFPTRLKSFSSIDLAGFLPQFSYWIRKFFTKLPK